MQETIFFAYESGHQENRDAILRGIEEYNQHQKSFKAFSWENLLIGGKIINQAVMKEIGECEIFACDLTYLNHNVLFELGYAIGKKKKLMPLLNTSIEKAVSNYKSFKILRGIGFSEFNNSKDILKALQKKEYQRKDEQQKAILEQLDNINKFDLTQHDVFYRTSKIENQASLDLTEMISYSNYDVIHDNVSEVSYQTLTWYIKNILQAKVVVIHLLGKDNEGQFIDNAESSLYAGLASGLGKEILLVAPHPFAPPIDYEDILIEYTGSEECALATNDWIQSKLAALEEEKETPETVKIEEKKLNLLRLGIGNEVAESEKNHLLSYFVEIDAYFKAINKDKSIFVGRKGSGKSALFIKLENELDYDNNNYNVILKPDSHELLENLELSKLYTSELSKSSFFKTVWSFLIYSKLATSIVYRIKEKNRPYTDPASIEGRLLDFYGDQQKLLELNFFGAIKNLIKILDGKSLVDNPEMLEQFHEDFFISIKKLIKEYFEERKYYKINILADNLDKTWDANHNLLLQSGMILSLLDFSESIINELYDNNLPDLNVNTIVFLREDIFDYIMAKSNEPDKLRVFSYQIDWNDYPQKLKKMLEKRFKYSLGISTDEEVNQVWLEYFNIHKKKPPFDVISEIVLHRPRDMIYFMSKLFESAVNNDSVKVTRLDLEYAVNAYTEFLNDNLIAETSAEFPDIREILNEVHLKFGNVVPYKEFRNVLTIFNYSDLRIDELLNSLFKKNYIIAVLEGGGPIINDLKHLKVKLLERKFFIFKKNKIFLIPSPDEIGVKSQFRRFMT